MTSSTVNVTHLVKEYPSGSGPRRVLSDISFEVPAGASLAIMGPSGTGKSTLLNILGTLDRPTSGSIDIFGVDPFQLNDRALAKFRSASVGFIFQSHHLLPQCSILENVLLPSLAAAPDATREAPRKRALRLIERVGLTSRMEARPPQLSGGECQRAAVVRSLINSPRLVLADEPTGSLDRASAEAIGALLSEFCKEEKVALIVVTHSDALAERMDRKLTLKDGGLA